MDLPHDILVLIFVASLSEVGDERDLTMPSIRQSPTNVSHVCRAWRQAALLTAQLWTRIYFNLSECHEPRNALSRAQSIQTFLDRSAKCSLLINITCHGNSLFNVQEDWRTLGDLVVRPIASNRSRWRMIKIIYPPQEWQRALEKGPSLILDGCSELEHLSFLPAVWPNGSFHPVSFQFDVSSSNRLSKLRINDTSCVNIELTGATEPSFANLTKLIIINCILSSNTTLAILANSPNLEDLRLRRTDGTLEDQSFFCFNRLRKIQLGERVRLFGISRASLRIEGGFQSFLERMTTPNLQELTLLLTRKNTNVSQILRRACEMLRRSSFPLVKFVLECSLVEDAILADCLNAMPLLEQLDIMLWDQYLGPVLGRLIVRPGEEDSRRCSHLKALTIRHSSPVEYTEEISRMLLSRSPAGNEPYHNDQTGRDALDPSVGRFGTAVLREFKVVYSWGLGDDDVRNFRVDSTIAALVGRGLEFDAGPRSDKFEMSDDNEW